jgi:hypothetical protein
MIKALMLSVLTLTLVVGCSCKVDNDVPCEAGSDKTTCPLTDADAKAAKSACPADCNKPCCATKAEAKAEAAPHCPSDCTKPCCAKPKSE